MSIVVGSAQQQLVIKDQTAGNRRSHDNEYSLFNAVVKFEHSQKMTCQSGKDRVMRHTATGRHDA